MADALQVQCTTTVIVEARCFCIDALAVDCTL